MVLHFLNLKPTLTYVTDMFLQFQWFVAQTNNSFFLKLYITKYHLSFGKMNGIYIHTLN